MPSIAIVVNTPALGGNGGGRIRLSFTAVSADQREVAGDVLINPADSANTINNEIVGAARELFQSQHGTVFTAQDKAPLFTSANILNVL